MRSMKTAVRSRTARIGVVVAVVAAGLIGTATPAFATATLPLTLSTARGPVGGTNVITATVTATTNFVVATPVFVEFQVAACSATAFTASGFPVLTSVTPTTTSKLTITVPLGITAASYYVCVYDGNTGTADTELANTTTAAYTVTATTVSSVVPARGPSGGTNTITATAVGTTFTTLPYFVEFQYAPCTANYAPAASITATVAATLTGGIIPVPTAGVTAPTDLTLNITVPTAVALLTNPAQTTASFNVCVYDDDLAGMGSLLSGTASTPYSINGGVLSLSSNKGPAGGLNTISASTSTGSFVAGSVGVEFQFQTCATTYQTTVTPAVAVGTTPVLTAGIFAATTVAIVSPTRLAITVPATLVLVSSQPIANYYVCVYDGTSTSTPGPASALISGSAGSYSIAVTATVTGVSPSAGAAQGGASITVTGTQFPLTGMTATVGGVAATNIVVAGNGLSFTATTPAHPAGGPFPIAVTTPGGTAIKAALFSYTNGIVVSPSTAPNTRIARAYLDVRGVGFADLVITNTTGLQQDFPKAHAYLVKGAYDPRPVGTPAVKANGQTLECTDILPVDDTELICSLFLGGIWADGTPTVAPAARTCASAVCSAANTAVVAPATATTSTLTGTVAFGFTQSDVGLYVSGGVIAAGTMITSITDSTHAVLSKALTGTWAAAAVVLSSSRTLTDAVTNTTLGTAANVSSTTTTFSAADLGKGVLGTGIPIGTTIISVTDSSHIVLSNAATAVGTVPTLTIFPQTPVPIGTYTVTVVNNGAVNAQTASGYTQSIISGGSTFTVADY
jgi:hypothetical protein